MKISDFIEVVIVDKNGMHKIETTKDIEEYIRDDKNAENNKKN